MQDYNVSQKKAIENACLQRVTLIQGPPGTGKTKALAGIISNMHMQNPRDQILVIASMNFTADLVADALYNIKMIYDDNSACRVQSNNAEDIFNIEISKLPEWSLLYNMIFDV